MATISHTETTQVNSQLLQKLFELSEAMLHGDYSKRIITNIDDEILTKIVDNLNRFADKVQLNTAGDDYSQEQTVNNFIEVISSFANLDFKRKLPISDNGTIMDAIATGINVLGDELEHSTASKQELEIERNRLHEAQAIAMVGSWDLSIPSYSLSWSDQAYRIFEIEQQQTSDTLYEDHRKKIHADDVANLDNAIKQAVEKSQGFALEYRIICHNGTSKYILCIGEAVKNDAGIATHLKGTIQDITEQKLVEEKLKEAKEYAEEANNAKSVFLANMSHEIRTPLNGILGLTEIMLGEEIKNEAHVKYLEIIRDSGRNLTQLINHVLDFSKIESGKLHLESISFNLHDIITSNVNPYKFLAQQKGLTFCATIDENIPKGVIGDPTRISQIITNLLGNAIKFTEHGSIAASFSLLKLGAEDVTIQGIVKDTGIGIPKEKENYIFQSFTQASNAVARRYGGTGLGLSIVKSLVQMMNGDISVQSPVDIELNRGSAFIFTLNLKLQEAQLSNQPSDPAAEKLVFKRPLHILIVDDNKVNILVAKKMVRKFGAEVTAVESGLEAIDLVKANQYDLVLMDIQMPEFDGYQTTMELRRLNYSKPILALSANAYNDDVQNSLKSGMNDHIQKPYTEKVLFDKISKFVG